MVMVRAHLNARAEQGLNTGYAHVPANLCPGGVSGDPSALSVGCWHVEPSQHPAQCDAWPKRSSLHPKLSLDVLVLYLSVLARARMHVIKRNGRGHYGVLFAGES
jgi:hypothetical protein